MKHEVNERLLIALTEHIKLPLLQIARRSELIRMGQDPLDHIEAIELTADTALKLLDNYLLSTRLASMQFLELEPVSIAAVLTDTAHELSKLARKYDCELEVNISGRYEPVLAHRQGLQAALASLGYVFIDAHSGSEPTAKQRPILKLAAHRGKNGIVAGLFTNTQGISSEMYRRAHRLYGHSRMALPELTTGSGAAVFVADALLNTMSANLRVARHQKLTGLAATLNSSNQLELV